MKVSRREFVSTAGYAAAASLCVLPSLGFASASGGKSKFACTLLDLKSNCALPESFAGMQLAIGEEHHRLAENELASSEFPSNGLANGDLDRVLIVAAAGWVRPETFRSVADLLERGAIVLWESGAAFVDPREFTHQRDLVREHFEISMGRPFDVWSQPSLRRSNAGAVSQGARSTRAIGHAQIPYVTYRWPSEAHLRDFSRVIPVSAANGRAIAHWRAIPVAWCKPIGAGKLVFLGSPVGPALRAGDSDAASLLRSLINVQIHTFTSY